VSVPRLSSYYELTALYFWERGQGEQCWFQLFAAWFYEDEDGKEWSAYRGQQISLDLGETASV
jgi:hypothetical protein